MSELTGKRYVLPQEDKTKVEMGFLPAMEHVMTIISNSAYYAAMRKEGVNTYATLIGWAFLKNGVVMPLIYDAEFRTCRNPEVLEDFVEINEEDFEDNDDKEFEIFKGE